MTNISKEAVEAAAKVLFGREYSFEWHAESVDDPMSVEAAFMRDARAALEAAAPLLMAQAWDEGWNAGYDDRISSTDDRNHEYAQNPYLSEGTGL